MTQSKIEPKAELSKLLEQETQRVQATYDRERRLGLIELVRAIDNFFVGQIAPGERTDTDIEIGRLIAYSLPKIFNLFLDDSTKNDGAPLFCSVREIQAWADSVLQHCGRIVYGEQMLGMCAAGLGEIETISEHEFIFRLSRQSAPFGVEARERENYEWLSRFITSEMQRPHIEVLIAARQDIWKQMSKRVHPWRQHYIQYTTSPAIDIFYQHDGLLHTQRMTGNDSFPREASFGGIDFGSYCAAIATLVGWAIKHFGFCIELLKKHPSLDPRNLLTITIPFETEVSYLATALEIDTNIAATIIDTITLKIDNKAFHCNVPGDWVAPLFIEIGNRQLLRPLYGAFSNPFFFLLHDLQRRYPRDWDRAVNEREKLFRKEIYDLFPSNRFHRLDRPIRIKEQGKVVTDIDAFVFDRQARTAGIFQLKWQDFIGASTRKRESQKSNLLHTGNVWIERVSHWLENTSPKDIARVLELDLEEVQNIEHFRLFLIGRNAAHFSGPGTPDPRAAWGHWLQFVRIVAEEFDVENPIEGLYTVLKANSPLLQKPPDLEQEIIQIGDTQIILKPLK